MTDFDGTIWQLAADDELDALRKLIASGANLDAQRPNKDEWTPLIYAAWHDRPKATKLLIDAKANVDIRASDGRTALHYAKSVKTMKLLLDAKANANNKDANGRTPLMEQTSHNWRAPLLSMLLNHKADATVKQIRGHGAGQTALDQATKAAEYSTGTSLIIKRLTDLPWPAPAPEAPPAPMAQPLVPGCSVLGQ